jgi:hypothetical protein
MLPGPSTSLASNRSHAARITIVNMHIVVPVKPERLGDADGYLATEILIERWTK